MLYAGDRALEPAVGSVEVVCLPSQALNSLLIYLHAAPWTFGILKALVPLQVSRFLSALILVLYCRVFALGRDLVLLFHALDRTALSCMRTVAQVGFL
jgi:hypothetical protein